MPESRRPSTRLLITGAVVAVVIIVVIIIVATGGDDDDSTTSASAVSTTSALVIQSPATVTGITGVAGADDSSTTSAADGGSPTTDGANTYPLVRTFTAPTSADCTGLGSWQPFAEIQLSVSVGQPAANTTCGDRVLDLPVGYCAETCTEVPADWKVLEDPDVTPQALMLLVAPASDGSNTAQFLCVKDFVPQVKKILPAATTIQDACLDTTSNSIEIPYVPPATSDIPYVPPPVSVDIPGTTVAG